MTQGGYGQGDSVNFIEEILNKQGAQGNEFTEALVVDGNKVDLASETVDQWLKEIKK
ncbi:hypothetical protein [Enterococcus timonensis]|uniref:hypothetical protein n=1 Tax=Enterococcus timonensis TaxID=1852364 RepID=UPI001F1EB549|nr:hypothetical protein [Enterococcus timonensis]